MLEVTDVDEAARRVRRFNDRPAKEEYARALEVAPDELESRFVTHPLAVVLEDGEPFVRSPQKVEGSDVVFYCKVRKGMALQALQSRNIVEDLDAT